MKVTKSLLSEIGLQHLIRGEEISVPKFLKKDVDLMYQDHHELTAFMCHRYLNDYRMMARIMIVLNKLVRTYQCDIVLHCLSYRALICHEKIYLTFKKKPISSDTC